MLRVRLQTGKKHQIRVHLAQRAVPIVNDPVYAKDKPQGRLMLAAVALTIAHPRTCKTMSFKIDPPQEMTLDAG
jgi:23S rRNA-/tRNA-specific pseudouridylate synthase